MWVVGVLMIPLFTSCFRGAFIGAPLNRWRSRACFGGLLYGNNISRGFCSSSNAIGCTLPDLGALQAGMSGFSTAAYSYHLPLFDCIFCWMGREWEVATVGNASLMACGYSAQWLAASVLCPLFVGQGLFSDGMPLGIRHLQLHAWCSRLSTRLMHPSMLESQVLAGPYSPHDTAHCTSYWVGRPETGIPNQAIKFGQEEENVQHRGPTVFGV